MRVLGLTEGKTERIDVLRSIIPHALPESVKQAGSPLLEQTSQVIFIYYSYHSLLLSEMEHWCLKCGPFFFLCS